MKVSNFTRNVLWNLAGGALPLFAGVAAIPYLVEQLGIARFGLLNLAWVVIGYFSIFDLGLGRSLTRFVAAKLGQQQEEDIPALVSTAMFLINCLGILGAALTLLLGQVIVERWLHVPPDMRGEALRTIWVLGGSIPFVLSSAGWRGILEAYHRFDWSNAVRIPLGIFTFVAPIIALQFQEGLIPVVTGLAVSRVAAWLVYRHLSSRLLDTPPRLRLLQFTLMKPLLSFGGWMTVSNIVGPLMVYADRFLIGSLISVAAVAYYATPYEVVTKLWIIPNAVIGVLFPMVSHSFSVSLPQADRMYQRTLQDVFCVMLPLAGAAALFAGEGLLWWLGRDFARQGTFVAQCLALAVLINSLGFVAHATLQAAGRVNWCAGLHLIEFPLYLVLLMWLAPRYGINGVALAWFARILVDTAAMLLLVDYIFRHTYYVFLKIMIAATVSVATIGIAAQIDSVLVRGALEITLLAATALLFARRKFGQRA